jgi:hypothetical protein
MAEERTLGHHHVFEDSDTAEVEIVDQFLPDDTAYINAQPAPIARKIIDVKLVNRL